MLQEYDNLNIAHYCTLQNNKMMDNNTNWPEMHESYSCHMRGKTYKTGVP